METEGQETFFSSPFLSVSSQKAPLTLRLFCSMAVMVICALSDTGPSKSRSVRVAFMAAALAIASDWASSATCTRTFVTRLLSRTSVQTECSARGPSGLPETSITRSDLCMAAASRTLARSASDRLVRRASESSSRFLKPSRSAAAAAATVASPRPLSSRLRTLRVGMDLAHVMISAQLSSPRRFAHTISALRG